MKTWLESKAVRNTWLICGRGLFPICCVHKRARARGFHTCSNPPGRVGGRRASGGGRAATAAPWPSAAALQTVHAWPAAGEQQTSGGSGPASLVDTPRLGRDATTSTATAESSDWRNMTNKHAAPGLFGGLYYAHFAYHSKIFPANLYNYCCAKSPNTLTSICYSLSSLFYPTKQLTNNLGHKLPVDIHFRSVSSCVS